VRCQVQDTPGLTGTGLRTVITIAGWLDDGTIRHMRELPGTILTTTITGKAGSCMKATGIMKTTTGITGMEAITTRDMEAITTIISQGSVEGAV
jgi:hypothetical protein